MTEFLSFLYGQYIKPYLAAQPGDDGDVAALLRFASVHAFLLDMRTGEGLAASHGSCKYH